MPIRKLLTISVAAYNVEKTLRETLDSLIIPEVLDKLEVFVVDDGGTDGSLEIAREYESRYPDTFHAVHKENGGYGSTVNYSVAHAAGKYFRLLDGDDWYASDNLKLLVESLEGIEADMIVTPCMSCGERSGKRVLNQICAERPDGVYAIEDLKHISGNLYMHHLCYKTSLLQSIDLRLTEHCFYTDMEYAWFPLPYVKTVYIRNLPIYLYRTEVAGQSMSISGSRRYWRDGSTVFWSIANVYKRMRDENAAALDEIGIALSIAAASNIRGRCILECGRESFFELKTFCNRLKKELPEIAESAMRHSKLVSALYQSHYVLYPLCAKYCLWKERRWRGGD